MNILDRNLYEEFVENIKERKNFSFSRYGDGELALVLQAEPLYSNLIKKWGVTIIEAGKKLEEILKNSPKYHIGIQPLAFSNWGEKIISFLPEGLDLSNSDIFHRNSIRNNLHPFLDSLKYREVILVGPSHLKKLNLFSFSFVETPDLNVWENVNELLLKVEQEIEKKKDPVILYSCSIAAKIIIDKIYQKHKDSLTQVDTGSLFDPYVGMNSRSYHQIIIERLKIPYENISVPRKK